jgi:hypothetical protein
VTNVDSAALSSGRSVPSVAGAGQVTAMLAPTNGEARTCQRPRVANDRVGDGQAEAGAAGLLRPPVQGAGAPVAEVLQPE